MAPKACACMADGLRVVDENMNVSPRMARRWAGVVMRIVMRVYDDRDEKAFRGGWFHSGDMAVIHPTATSNCATAAKTHHQRRRKHFVDRSRANALPPPRRPRMRDHRHTPRKMGRDAQSICHTQRRPVRHRRRTHYVLPRRNRALQMPDRHRVRRASKNQHRQNSKIRPAREGMERLRHADSGRVVG